MMTNESMEIKKLREDNNGELPAYAWPGGYPIYYIDEYNDVLCPECANENTEYNPKLVVYSINWEDDYLYCADCSSPIESAYPEEN